MTRCKGNIRSIRVPYVSLVELFRGMRIGTYAWPDSEQGIPVFLALSTKTVRISLRQKRSRLERDLDRDVLLLIAVRNTRGSMVPDFGRAGKGTIHRDTTGTARSNHPDGHKPATKVRRPQNQLCAPAKHACPRRFPVNDPSWSYCPLGGRGARTQADIVTILRRPSVSSVRENCMNSSMGRYWKRSHAARSSTGAGLAS